MLVLSQYHIFESYKTNIYRAACFPRSKRLSNTWRHSSRDTTSLNMCYIAILQYFNVTDNTTERLLKGHGNETVLSIFLYNSVRHRPLNTSTTIKAFSILASNSQRYSSSKIYSTVSTIQGVAKKSLPYPFFKSFNKPLGTVKYIPS